MKEYRRRQIEDDGVHAPSPISHLPTTEADVLATRLLKNRGIRARAILEELCLHGDNVWQTGMLSLMAVSINKLLEAWSRERKDEIVRKNAERGMHLLDYATFDDYNLTLWRVPVDTDFEPSGTLHAVAINSDQHDPTDEQVQRLKFPGSSLRHLPVSSLSATLRNWIQDHGKLAVGTVELRKLSIYRRFLQKQGFKITNMSAIPEHGFFIESEN